LDDLILVTGGAGFIGQALIRKLTAGGRRVRVLDNLSEQIHGPSAMAPAWFASERVDFIRGSVTEREHWVDALEGVTAIAHLAAETGTGQSMYEIERYNAVNSQGTALMLDVLAQNPSRTVKRIVLTSSRSVYGEGRYECPGCGQDPVFPEARTAAALAEGRWDPECDSCNSPLRAAPTQETDALRPASIYAATKLAQEQLLTIAASAMAIPYVILRLQNVYGEGQSLNNPYTGILSIFTTKLRHGSHLPLFEDGEESRDFVHVDDVAECLVRALDENLPSAIINVGSGVGTSVRDVAGCLCDCMRVTRDLRTTGEYRLGDIRHNFADISRMRQLLDYEPQVRLEDGLERLTRWALGEALARDALDEANHELRQRGLMAS
jgi:dTDP-L-rhamnose 4-epimerase